MLDIDGFRIDKGQQVTVDAAGHWSNFIRDCASSFGKKNFFIPVCTSSNHNKLVADSPIRAKSYRAMLSGLST